MSEEKISKKSLSHDAEESIKKKSKKSAKEKEVDNEDTSEAIEAEELRHKKHKKDKKKKKDREKEEEEEEEENKVKNKKEKKGEEEKSEAEKESSGSQEKKSKLSLEDKKVIETEVHTANNWEEADLGNDQRKLKFLKLMGAFKHKSEQDVSHKHARAAADTQKIAQDLEKQFNEGLSHKFQAKHHMGLGYHADEPKKKPEKKMPESKHITFDDDEDGDNANN